MDIITMNFALVLAMLMLVIASGNIGVLVVYYGGNNNDGEEHVKSYKDLYKTYGYLQQSWSYSTSLLILPIA